MKLGLNSPRAGARRLLPARQPGPSRNSTTQLSPQRRGTCRELLQQPSTPTRNTQGACGLRAHGHTTFRYSSESQHHGTWKCHRPSFLALASRPPQATSDLQQGRHHEPLAQPPLPTRSTPRTSWQNKCQGFSRMGLPACKATSCPWHNTARELALWETSCICSARKMHQSAWKAHRSPLQVASALLLQGTPHGLPRQPPPPTKSTQGACGPARKHATCMCDCQRRRQHVRKC
mmetsp:Transcript_12399/g.32061  ORF Transcript_12399/g.32061 Transcript_12399/m.32061 type:complete len:233 (-) Transcript_12399:582-1280(-)